MVEGRFSRRLRAEAEAIPTLPKGDLHESAAGSNRSADSFSPGLVSIQNDGLIRPLSFRWNECGLRVERFQIGRKVPRNYMVRQLAESPTVGKFGQLPGTCSENGSQQLVNGCPAHFLCPSDPFFVFEYLALGRVNDKSACLMGFRHAELFGLAGEVLWRNAEG